MPFLVVIIVMIVGFAAAVTAAEERSRRERQFAEAAQRLKGAYSPGGLLSRAKLEFPLHGQRATMTFVQGRQASTRLVVELPSRHSGRLSIAPRGVGAFFLRLVGIREVPIGDRLFDEQYFVQSRPAELARMIFAPGRRTSAMTSVRRLNHCAGFLLELDGRFLNVRVAEYLDTADLVMAMARTAEEFMGFLGAGLELSHRADGRCPICATALVGLLHRCARCHAPHHQECWEYVGRCAIYGCEPERRVA